MLSNKVECSFFFSFFFKQTAILHMAREKTIPEIPGMGAWFCILEHFFVWLYIGSNLLDLRAESQEEKTFMFGLDVIFLTLFGK